MIDQSRTQSRFGRLGTITQQHHRPTAQDRRDQQRPPAIDVDARERVDFQEQHQDNCHNTKGADVTVIHDAQNTFTVATLHNAGLANGAYSTFTSTKIRPSKKPITGKKIADGPTSSAERSVRLGQGKRVKNCSAAKKQLTEFFP